MEVKMVRKFDFLTLLLLSLLLLSCSTTPSVPDSPPPKAVYNFEFSPPVKAARKVGTTIGILAPSWDKNISSTAESGKQAWLDAGVNPNPNELLQGPNLMAHAGPAPAELRNIAREFTRAVEKDFEVMMIAKGFDTMGPFASVDEMTYPQKTACNIVIIPEFSQVVKATKGKMNTDIVEGTAVIRTEITLTAYEPLSKEKLWMKRFNNESTPFDYRVKYKINRSYDKAGNLMVQRQGITWDNRPAGFADAFTALYQEVMKKSWEYFSQEEIQVLRNHSDEIRAKKRF
jgi:hypothetical protein